MRGLGSEVISVRISAVLIIGEIAVTIFLSRVHNCFFYNLKLSKAQTPLI